MDWNVVASKVGGIFSERCNSVRKNIPVDKLFKGAMLTMSNAEISSENPNVALDASILTEIINKINGDHHAEILEIAESMGSVVGKSDKAAECELMSEEKDHILISAKGLLIKMEKNMAIKIATLGSLP